MLTDTETVPIVDLKRDDVIVVQGRRITVVGCEPAADLGGPADKIALWWDARQEGHPSTHISDHWPGERVERVCCVRVIQPILVEDSEAVQLSA